MAHSGGNLIVAEDGDRRGQVALNELVVAAAHAAAIAPEQDCVPRTGGNLGVAEAGARRRQVALTDPLSP